MNRKKDRKRICLVGSDGRMGQALKAEISKDKVWRITALITSKILIWDVDPETVDLVIDFSVPEATMKSARYCAKHGLPLVAGTTGLQPLHMENLKKCAKKTAILWSSNMCAAVNVLARMLADFTDIFPQADIEIVEQHHNLKPDAPSGTALFWAQAMNPSGFRRIVTGRPQGESGYRDPQDIYIHALRGGDVAGGSNEVSFLLGQEEIKISHRTFSNQGYAQGALLAAKWLLGKPVGFYSMLDVFELKNK